MKTFIKLLTYIGIICMINSCSSFKEEKAQGLKTIHMEVDNLLGGKFNRIKASDKSICISDGDAIYRFSRSGEYLGKIAQKGQGPKHIR